MSKKILMVYPEFPTTYWSLKYALTFIEKKTAIVPLGLLTVAALLPEEYSISLIDMNVSELKERDIKGADLVFISAMIVQKVSFEKIVALCNNLKVPVVAGGPYPTSSYQKISGVDHFVLNEAEITLPPFIHDYEHGNPQRVYLDKEKPDITKTPPPRFDLIDINNYNNIALQNSRGCPFNCEFCDIVELFGRVPRFKESCQFIHEMELVYSIGFRGSLFIVDDNFIGNKKKVKELLRAIVDWQKDHDYPFSLFTEASINLADDDELLNLMVEAGFDMVFVGIETPDIDSLKSCNKSENLKVDMLKSIEKIQKSGIEVTGGFIVGFDGDTEDIFDRQIEFIQKAAIPMAMIGILGALPNTGLYRRLKSEGRLKVNNDFSGNNTHNLQMSFVPIMPERTIIDGYKKIISEIYSPKKYFERCFSFLKRLPEAKMKVSRTVRWIEIKAFLRSFIKQAFSKYFFYYLRFLFKVLIHEGKRFPLAIELAIKGNHFFIITKDIIKADELSTQLDRAMKSIEERFPENGVIGDTPVDFTADDVRIVVRYRKKLGKRYDKLSKDVQFYLSEEFNDYVKYFNAHITRI